MSSFIKIKSQFNQFIKSLKADELTTYEIKLINLLSDNFNSVASVGTASGKRASLINDLINQNRTTVSVELPNIEEATSLNSGNIKKLNSLEVENFRGFASKETFQLDRPKVLVYGPNGSGKTSFCEALEFSLLGYLSEAEAKRIEVRQYVSNVNTQKFSQPIITGTNLNDEIVNLSTNPDSYYFCFIEKNRIIDFARYSSKTTGQQESLLATLFGLDEFYTFINGFTENISGRIPVESQKQKELDKKTVEISGQKQNIENSTKQIENIDEQKKVVASNSKLNKTFEELDLYINGDKEQIGRINQIDEELQKPQGKLFHHPSSADLFNSISVIEKLIAQFESNNVEFEKEKDKISFRGIFQLVQTFENTIADKCPVCETPVEQTIVNPYENARVKLKELENIAAIEQNRDVSWNNLITEVYTFILEFENRKKSAIELQENLSINISEQLKDYQKQKTESKSYIKDLRNFFEDIKQQKELITTIEQKITSNNNKTNSHLENIKLLRAEKDVLSSIKKQIDDINANIKSHRGIIETAKKAVVDFDNGNKSLIEEITKEKEIIEENKKFVDAYYLLLQKLNKYKKELPLTLVENLNELTKDFYNFINKDDNKFELIEKIQLPSNAGERIKIWFQDNPDAELDAMHILSEGHTRCLGLSILLAKVVHDKLPFIVFDDIVNAIDHDHRGRIRELLFDNPIINEKQIIITSHSEEYIKDIENKHFTKQGYEKERVLYAFLKPTSKTIRKIETTKHYLNKASEYYNEHSYRDCLMECRRALENLSNDLWYRASKKYVFQVSYKVRAPLLPPDLMGIVTSLKKELTALKVSDFDTSLSILTWLSGLETKNNQIWNYLNKGTHEESEREDFDPIIVKEVLDQLVGMETELHKNKK